MNARNRGGHGCAPVAAVVQEYRDERMTVRLAIHRAAWQAHVDAAVDAHGPGLVPVVKGNGYGFGRPYLHAQAAAWADTVCVGTVHELHDVPAALTPVVLTPTLQPPADTHAILTVGSVAHATALRGWDGRVIVKLASSMRRYGVDPAGLGQLTASLPNEVVAFGLHLPLAGTDADRVAEIEAWLPHLPADTPLWISHLAPQAFAALQAGHPDRRFRIRVGTGLWHGSPRGDFLHLTADVLHTQPVSAGDIAGYQHSTVATDGTLIAIGAGSTHGIALLDDADPARRSPFHFERQRLPLLERPHMHTTLAVVPTGQPCPQVGDRVDVQRPLITTMADELEWLP